MPSAKPKAQVERDWTRSKETSPTHETPATSLETTLQQRIKSTIGMELVLIPAGSFMMGSSKIVYRKNEKPPHEVEIPQSFYLQITQVSQRQWQGVMWNNPSDFRDCGADCPVEKVSWDDTKKFIQKLNVMEGTNNYRLPTEAEWEYACRAGTTTDYSFGDDADELGKYAWFVENSDKRTHSVGKKKPNAWGLYDMHGNVWEWVEDDWHDTYVGAPDDGRPWIDHPRAPNRTGRGGGWGNDAQECRSAGRSSGTTDHKDGLLGFRLAKSVSLGP